MSRHFKAAYRQARFEAALLHEETLASFVAAIGLVPKSDNIDRIRIIVWDWLRGSDRKETQHLLDECQPPVRWATFEKQLSALKKHYDQQSCSLPTDHDYAALGLRKSATINSKSPYPRQLIFLVLKAGLIAVVALTGWRKSEYGFPIKAINQSLNDDKLDQYAFPWRYQVDWVVPKQHGEIRKLREVTFCTVVIAKRLHSLLGATGDQPCLYGYFPIKKTFSESGGPVSSAVQALWGHFVHHYSGFKQLDNWVSWQGFQRAVESGKSMTTAEQRELDQLLAQRSAEEWSNLSVDVNLKEAWRRAREEWPRVELFFASTNRKDKANWLASYRDSTLRSDWIDLLDEYLPDTTKEWLHSISREEIKSGQISRTVTNQLVSETLYPSPHAFRHMWAEAVYRRFDGDAGWMIRSQFKQISRTMWLAYIRDKDNRADHGRAKSQVISSLVHNYLRHQGKGYAGQLHTWLRRLFKITSVLSPQEQEQLAEHLATIEIENIKANPWGYCLLKRRTRHLAKCAEMGEPMRHNASPVLCLSCVHNLMQSGNVEWAVFHVAAHVEALNNPVVPAIFKVSSYELVKNVTRHVRTLNPEHEALPELQLALNTYKASRVV